MNLNLNMVPNYSMLLQFDFWILFFLI